MESSLTSLRSESKGNGRTSLVAQWIKVCQPMQGTWVQSLIQEELTCHGAAEPVHQHYWSPWAWSPRSATRGSLHLSQLQKARLQQEAPVQSKINKNVLKRAMTTKAKINTQNYMKLQSICTTKKTINKWKVHLLHWRRYLLILYPRRR